MKKLILSGIVAILIILVVVLTSVQILVNDDGFFVQQYSQNDISRQTGIESTELMRITDEIQRYLFGQRADFNISGEVAGKRQQIFNKREIDHMQDVRVLFSKGIMLRNGCVLIMTVLLFALWKKSSNLLFSALLLSALAFFIFMLVGGLLLYFDFNRYFVLFHEIFFNNDLWILDPQTSILINMVPLAFFFNIVKAIGLLASLSMLLIGLLGALGKFLFLRSQKS